VFEQKKSAWIIELGPSQTLPPPPSLSGGVLNVRSTVCKYVNADGGFSSHVLNHLVIDPSLAQEFEAAESINILRGYPSGDALPVLRDVSPMIKDL